MRASHLVAACCLDFAVGDPHWFPHPVRAIGWSIGAGERWLRPGTRAPGTELLRGGLLAVGVVAGTAAAARFVTRTGSANVLFAWTALAAGSLRREALAVLDSPHIEKARERLALIVGRDTAELDESEIARAVIETVAEGLCDGVVAPLFYLALGGPAAAFAYKATNTLDSMIGHPEPPYQYFGRVAARLDDGANFLPARLAAGAIVVAARSEAAWRMWRRDGARHPSPNAGQTEAAMAGALGVRLGGVNYYAGVPSKKPLLGAECRPPTVKDARRAVGLGTIASVLACGVAVLFCAWRSR